MGITTTYASNGGRIERLRRMATKRLDLKQMTLAYGAASVVSLIAGSVSGGLWAELGGNTNYSLWLGGSWLVVVGLPSMAVASDTLLKTLGKKSPIQIISNGGKQSGRPVPINWGGGKTSTVFLSSLPMIGGGKPEPVAINPSEVPRTYTVNLDDGSSHTLTDSEVMRFLDLAYRRQTSKKAPFSRNYWTKQRRPSMPKQYYQAMMILLGDVIADRGPGRSGKLLMPPGRTMKVLGGMYRPA